MNKLIFRLKSGREIAVTCEHYTFNTSCGKLMSYKLEGVTENYPVYLPCDAIECVWNTMEENKVQDCPNCGADMREENPIKAIKVPIMPMGEIPG